MPKQSVKRIAMLTALGLSLILTTGCAHGLDPWSEEIKVKPSAEFLYDLAHEHNTREYGDATESVVNDWIAQNEPEPSI